MLKMKHYKVLEKLDDTKDRKTKGIIDVLTDHNFVVSDYESYKDENAILCLKWTEKGRKWIVENYKKW